VEVTVRLKGDGMARVEVEERLTGVGAMQWRSMLRRLDRARLNKLFEHAALGMVFPGASLEQLTFRDEKATERPLGMRYVFSTANLARLEQGKLLLKVGLYHPFLSRLYLGLARRQHGLQVAFHSPTTVNLRVIPPAGGAIAPPPRVDLRTPFGDLRREARSAADGSLALRTELRVSFRRIPSAEFPSFARFATTVDAHFKAEAQVRPR